MNILFLCCCSNRKLAGGEGAYRPTRSMPQEVSRRSRDLFRGRRAVCRQIQDGARSALSGALLRELQYNAQPPLALGPDLGGEEHGKYLPAQARYRGRFYQQLDPHERGALSDSPHHWLIVSLLYGLLTPEEPIQRYSCHTLDDPALATPWTDDGLLTEVLLEYVRRFEIELVVDLLADASYRDLLDWGRIADDVKVLRAVGAQNAGPALLPALGQLGREKLLHAPAAELFGIEEYQSYVTDYEDVALTHSLQEPPPGFLLEASPEPEPPPEPASDAESTFLKAAYSERIVQYCSSSLPGMVLRSEVARDSECIVLPHAREIWVSSKGHRTIFGYQINRIRDLPTDARRWFDQISRAAEVLDVQLKHFRTKGKTSRFKVKISAPGRNATGIIDGCLTGPGKIGGSQDFHIRVTPGREQTTHQALQQLLKAIQ